MVKQSFIYFNNNARKQISSTRRSIGVGYSWFTRGDVFAIGYRLSGFGYVFTGLCIRVRNKSLMRTASTFVLRNIFAKVSVELCVSLYGLCRLNFKFLDYAKKKFHYRASKLYYLRDKSNVQSW